VHLLWIQKRPSRKRGKPVKNFIFVSLRGRREEGKSYLLDGGSDEKVLERQRRTTLQPKQTDFTKTAKKGGGKDGDFMFIEENACCGKGGKDKKEGDWWSFLVTWKKKAKQPTGGEGKKVRIKEGLKWRGEGE